MNPCSYCCRHLVPVVATDGPGILSGLRRLILDAVTYRSWLSSWSVLRSSGGSIDHVGIVDESLLASLLLVLQQLPSLLTSPPRSDAVPKVREGLSQVRRLLFWNTTLLLPSPGFPLADA